jgi:hypothetical protein
MQPASQSREETIGAIRSAFGGDDPAMGPAVSKENVLGWMRSPDIEVRGALYSKITNAACAKRIEPPLQSEDYFCFVVPYLEQCIEQNPDGEWAESRYLAGHALAAWIKDFWNDKEVPRAKLAEIKRRLGDLYRRGDEDVRDGVLNGVLEHLFESRPLANYFREWEGDPVLGRAYSDALLWTKKKL